MIIDSTVSAMEDRMDKFRRLDEYINNRFCKKPGWGWPSDRKARIEYRESAIRDFLIKQGKNPGESSNCVAFWKDGEIMDVHFLGELIEKSANESAKEEKEYAEHFQGLLDKFVNFMRFGILSNQKNQEPSE